MEKVKISVILPVYNGESTLSRAIESVLEQEETAFELIIVDDGSEDKSGEIAEYYVEKDRRITLIKQTNGGPLAAIRAGMQSVKGDFVAFIDADDVYHRQYLSELYHLVIENAAEISVCGFYSQTGGEMVECKMCQGEKVYERKEIQENIIGIFLSERILMGARWNKLIKRACVENSLKDIANDFCYGEDVVMVLGAFFEASKIVVSEKSLYYHYDTEQSLEKIMSGIDRRIESAKEMYKNVIEVLLRYDRMDLLPFAAYYHYTEVLAYLKTLMKEMKKYNECKNRMNAVLEDSTTRHALKYAKKRTWKSYVVIWLMKRRWTLPLMVLLKNAG